LLVPQLARLTTFTRTSLISGGIWAVWHYPAIIAGRYHGDGPIWYGLICFTIMVIATSFAFNWMRLRSGSLWTGMWMHASHNLFIQGVFDRVTFDTGPTPFLIGELGAALAVVTVIVALVFWRMRSALPDTVVRGETV